MATSKKTTSTGILVNRKAFFSYQILSKYVAGIVLQGAEVKSIRAHKVNLKDAYCYFKANELWLKGLYISSYEPAGPSNLDPMRPRKLLLHKQELRKLKKQKTEKSFTIVALRLFFNDKQVIKVEIALARGKKNYDKRLAIKERDLARTKRISTGIS